MKQRESSIIIYERHGSYYADVTGMFGGGFGGALAGRTIEEAAIFALRMEAMYIKRNPLGGYLASPAEVKAAIEKLRCPAPVKEKVAFAPILPERMDRLLDLIDRVQCALGEIHMIYRDRGEFTQGDAELHMPVLLEAANLVYFLQDAARRRIARP